MPEDTFDERPTLNSWSEDRPTLVLPPAKRPALTVEMSTVRSPPPGRGSYARPEPAGEPRTGRGRVLVRPILHVAGR